MDQQTTEKVVLYGIYTNAQTFKPTMKIFEVVAPSDSQDAAGLSKIVFLSSNGASENCGKDSGVIRLFQENCPLVFQPLTRVVT